MKSVASSARHRVVSWVIDAVALLVLAVVLEAILPTPSAMIYTSVAVVAYFVVTPSVGFDTLGHLIVGIRVVSLEEDDVPAWMVRTVRLAVVAVLAAPCLVGMVASAFSMFAHPTASAWHDAATRTAVIKVAPMQFRRAVRTSADVPPAGNVS